MDRCSGCARRYGLLHLLWDLFLVLITSGLWLIWIFIREMRRPRVYCYCRSYYIR